MQDTIIATVIYAFFAIAMIATISFMTLMIRHEFSKGDRK